MRTATTTDGQFQFEFRPRCLLLAAAAPGIEKVKGRVPGERGTRTMPREISPF